MTAASRPDLLQRLRAALPCVVVLAAGVFLYIQADNFEFEQVSGRIGPGAWPKLILALMLAAALYGIGSALLKTGSEVTTAAESQAQDEDLAHPPEIHPVRVWLAVAATLVYIALLEVTGFFLATVLYNFVLMYLGEFRNLLRMSFLSLAIPVSFMFIFMRIVYVALPLGMSPFDRVSLAVMSAIGVH